MEVERAAELLNGCVREELQDHAFGDAEVFWRKNDTLVAEGYFSGPFAEVVFEIGDVKFFADDARKLRNCGTMGAVSRNDSTGPDTYSEGEIMSGLTLEGVRKELTGE